MTIKQFYDELKTAGIPAALRLFKEPQELPFIVYDLPSRDDVHADNSVHCKVYDGFVELYTDKSKRDFDLEAKVEYVFIRNYIPYRMEYSEYIKDEKMNVTRWSFQLIE